MLPSYYTKPSTGITVYIRCMIDTAYGRHRQRYRRQHHRTMPADVRLVQIVTRSSAQVPISSLEREGAAHSSAPGSRILSVSSRMSSAAVVSLPALTMDTHLAVNARHLLTRSRVSLALAECRWALAAAVSRCSAMALAVNASYSLARVVVRAQDLVVAGSPSRIRREPSMAAPSRQRNAPMPQATSTLPTLLLTGPCAIL